MKKILFLEDEELLAKMYEKKLLQAGYEVLWTKTPEEAEQKSREFDADIVILDHGIKNHELSGADALAMIKKYLPKAYYIILSNYNSLQLQEKMSAENVQNYLLKINTTPSILLEYIQGL